MRDLLLHEETVAPGAVNEIDKMPDIGGRGYRVLLFVTEVYYLIRGANVKIMYPWKETIDS